MARKTFKPKKDVQHEAPLYAAFIADLLDATITATKLIETRPGGKLKLEYDEPNGQARRVK